MGGHQFILKEKEFPENNQERIDQPVACGGVFLNSRGMKISSEEAFIIFVF